MFLKNWYLLIEKHNIVCSFILSFVGTVAAVFAVWIARKIFKEGLRVDRDKILNEFALEVVTEFIIPFKKFKYAFETIQDGLGNVIEDSTLSLDSAITVIKGAMFQAQFPYYESHK